MNAVGFINDHVLKAFSKKINADEYLLFFSDIIKLINDKVKICCLNWGCFLKKN